MAVGRIGSTPIFGTIFPWLIKADNSMIIQQYVPVVIMMAVAFAIGLAPVLFALLVAPRRPGAAKLSPYECGFDAFEDARIPFNVKFYLVAILFIIFDLETAFLFPWAVSFRKIGWVGFSSMMVFLAILIAGFIYEWRKGALEWD